VLVSWHLQNRQIRLLFYFFNQVPRTAGPAIIIMPQLVQREGFFNLLLLTQLLPAESGISVDQGGWL